MDYSRSKLFAGLLSVLSVAVTFFAAALIERSSDRYLRLTAFALIAAALAAFLNIWLSQRLKKKRVNQQVFVVYAREDAAIADSVAAKLREAGFEPWIDRQQLRGGEEWRPAILQALQQSAAAVVLVSRNLRQSGLTRTELRVAADVLQGQARQSPIIPVLLDDSEIPASLRHIHAVDLNAEGGMDRLIDGLRAATGITTTA